MRIVARTTRIAFLTDIITPYMAAELCALSQCADLTAVFCSYTGTRGMEWHLQAELPFRHEVVDGLTIRRREGDGTDYYFSPRIVAALHHSRAEVVFSSGFSVPSLYGAIYSHAVGSPLLIQSDGTSRSESRLRVEQRLARRALRHLAWGAVANSEPAARRFAELGFPTGRIFRAPHATRIEPFWRVAENRAPAGRGSLRVLSVGRLIPRKGCEWLIRAVARARHAGANVELVVVGTGSDEARLKMVAAELGVTVAWRGFVDQSELPLVYASADAFAFPTLDDPFGMVLLEAAATALPVIASPWGGATEDLVRDGIHGFVVDPTDTTAMATAIARLAGAPELRTKMGRAAHAATLARTPSATAAGYLEAAEAALAGFAGQPRQ